MRKISVLGAGVLGCSVALALRASGHEVNLISNRRMSDVDAQGYPSFSSAYPAASIIAHSVDGPHTAELTALSEEIFELLARTPQTGVRKQRHAELFERKKSVPEQIAQHRNLRVLSGANQARYPRRMGIERIYGYSFDCYFSDMPYYSLWLERSVAKAGVEFTRTTLDNSALIKLRSDLLVNCLGIGATSVFADLPSGIILRGVLVKCTFEHPKKPILSYNYTPAEDVFSYEKGEPADIYFYPREGNCILGGTREPGHFDPHNGCFVSSTSINSPLIKLGNAMVPKPIVELNSELVLQLTGRRPLPPFQVLTGLRHLAGQSDNPGYEIALRSSGRKTVVDCFGFGGAGVTLSWGAALRVQEICDNLVGLGRGTPRTQQATALKLFISRLSS